MAKILLFRNIIIYVILFLSGLISLTAHGQINADQVMTIGKNVMSMEDYMLAIQYFNQAIKAKPYLADPYFYRAIAKLSLEDYEGAEEDCNLAIERNRFKTEVYKVRGFARQLMGKDSLAIMDYDIGLNYNPTDKNFLFYKAVAQSELKKYDDAENTFSTLLNYYPKFDDGYTARARLQLEKGDTIAALDDVNHALSISKSQINPYLILAEIEWKRKNWPEAGKALDAAIRLRPEVADLYVNRAFVKYNTDDFFGAMNDYNYAIELQPENTSALFNRALLRYEVKDLERSEEDFTKVLEIDPENFHALYNRGLVRLELSENKEALQDFNKIVSKYPRFYPVYYAMGEAKRNEGDMKTAMRYVHYADELVEKYVENPEKNALDRPKIAASESYDAGNKNEEETETEVMEKFNHLKTVSSVKEQQLTYNEKIKGRVQDRDVKVEYEPLYAVSFLEAPESLQSVSNYFRELDDLNRQNLISHKLYLIPDSVFSSGDYSEYFDDLFEQEAFFSTRIKNGQGRPVDYLSLGIINTSLKNYPDALSNLDIAISMDPRFTVSYMARGFARYADAKSQMKINSDKTEAKGYFEDIIYSGLLQEAIEDFNKAIELNPKLIFAWFNKGNILLEAGDYNSAMQCFAKAIEIDAEFGPAYFNRGLTYMQLGNKQKAFEDLSKAGELGILPSYNILKRMK